MKNKSKSQKTSPLSAENYLRQRARKLPVYECWISEGWEEYKMCTIIVTRQHPNGNFTFATYLVDLMCMGVKDTDYSFNLSPLHYAELVEKYKNHHHLEQIEYVLAHNIIYTAWEFAEDCGLKPTQAFLKTTQFMLDEDTDDIEIIEIECGQNGFPTLICGPHNKVEVARAKIILEKTLGLANFKVIYLGKFADKKTPDYNNEMTDDVYDLFDDEDYYDEDEIEDAEIVEDDDDLK